MRGQVSLEAIMLTGVIILVFFSLLQVASERTALAGDTGEAGKIKMIGELLATVINNVYANGEGFSIYLGPDVLNYTELENTTGIGGVGLALPIMINLTDNTIILRKNMSHTELTELYYTSVPIIPTNIDRRDPYPSAIYNETTILNNGTYVIIYAQSTNIKVVS